MSLIIIIHSFTHSLIDLLPFHHPFHIQLLYYFYLSFSLTLSFSIISILFKLLPFDSSQCTTHHRLRLSTNPLPFVSIIHSILYSINSSNFDVFKSSQAYSIITWSIMKEYKLINQSSSSTLSLINVLLNNFSVTNSHFFSITILSPSIQCHLLLSTN